MEAVREGPDSVSRGRFYIDTLINERNQSRYEENSSLSDEHCEPSALLAVFSVLTWRLEGFNNQW